MTIADNLRVEVKRHAQIFIYLCATEIGFTKHKSSVIAAASVADATNGLLFYSVDELLTTLPDVAGIDSDCLQLCQEQIKRILTINLQE